VAYLRASERSDRAATTFTPRNVAGTISGCKQLTTLHQQCTSAQKQQS
jgi:hypothetical protein